MTLQGDNDLYKRVPCFDLEKRDKFLSCEGAQQCVKLSPIWNDTKQMLQITKRTNITSFVNGTFGFNSPKPKQIQHVMKSYCDEFVDVQVKVLEVRPPSSISWNQKQVDLQKVVLADASGTIYCELWGNYTDSIERNNSYDIKCLKVMGEDGSRYLKTTKFTSVELLKFNLNGVQILDQRDLDELLQGPYREIKCEISYIKNMNIYKKCPSDWCKIKENNFKGNFAKCESCSKAFHVKKCLLEIFLNIGVTVLDDTGSNDEEILLAAYSSSLNELVDESEKFCNLEEDQIYEMLLEKKFRIKYHKVNKTVASISFLKI